MVKPAVQSERISNLHRIILLQLKLLEETFYVSLYRSKLENFPSFGNVPFRYW
ncbi:protein of unknown function [Lactiplantibacillus plantarum]